MSNTQTVDPSSSVDTLYEQFLADPLPAARHVHFVLAQTDTQTLLNEQTLLSKLIANKAAVPALILQPRRHGAVWMAHSYAHRLGLTVGNEVGLLGFNDKQKRGQHANVSSSAVVFSTCGNILKQTSLLQNAECVILCNTQTRTISMSLIKAVLKQRLRENKRLFMVIYTNDHEQFDADLRYFSASAVRNFTMSYHVSDSIDDHYPCVQKNAEAPFLETVMTSLTDGTVTTGVVVCVHDQHTANIVENRIAALCEQLTLTHIETIVITNLSQLKPEVADLQCPEAGRIRVLINIGVLESAGITIDWIDKVISNGLEGMFQPVPINGGFRTVATEVSKATVRQQVRIVANSGATGYLLCSKTPVDALSRLTAADIHTLPPTEIVLQALEVGLNPLKLELEAAGIGTLAMTEACTRLHYLGLVDYDRQFDMVGSLERATVTLTQSGWQGSSIQLGIISRAILAAAKRLDMVPVMLPILATLEAGWMRHKVILPHMFDQESDILDATMAFVYALTLNELPADQRIKKAEACNISFRAVKTAQRILGKLVQYIGTQPDMSYYQREPDAVGGVACTGGVFSALRTDEQNAALRLKIKACLLVGHLHTLFWNEEWSADAILSRTLFSNDGFSYRIGSASVVRSGVTSVISGSLARIVVKANQRAFTIIEGVTLYTKEDLHYAGQVFPDLIARVNLTRRQRHLFCAPVPLNPSVYPLEVVQPAASMRPLKDTKTSITSKTPSKVIELSPIELSVISSTTIEPIKTPKPEKKTVVPPAALSAAADALAAAWGGRVATASSKRR